MRSSAVTIESAWSTFTTEVASDRPISVFIPASAVVRSTRARSAVSGVQCRKRRAKVGGDVVPGALQGRDELLQAFQHPVHDDAEPVQLAPAGLLREPLLQVSADETFGHRVEHCRRIDKRSGGYHAGSSDVATEGSSGVRARRVAMGWCADLSPGRRGSWPSLAWRSEVSPHPCEE